MTNTSPALMAEALAGLGLFFVGLKMLSANLKGLAGKQFQRLLGRVSERPLAAVLGGVAAGFVTQSGRTTSYLLAGVVQAGMLSVRRVLPMVWWSNLGCTLIVFAAVLPLREVIMVMVGIGGIAVAFNRPTRRPEVAGAVFGAALLLFGLSEITLAAGGFAQFHWFTVAMEGIKSSYFLGFMAGLGLTLVAQSHMAIILIALAMTQAKFFDFDQAVMIIYGAQAGSSAITYLMGAGIRGTARQVMMGQVIYNLGGALLFVALFYGELLLGTDWLHRFMAVICDDAYEQAGLAAVWFNLVTPLGFMAIVDPCQRWLARKFPPSERETLAMAQYLQEQALETPETALVLVEKEQLRLLDWLTGHLAVAREGGKSADIERRKIHHEAFAEVTAELHQYFADLLKHPPGLELTEHLLNLQNRQEHLQTAEAVAWEMLTQLRDQAAHPGDPVQALGLQLLEGFDTQLLTLAAALKNNDADELKLLRSMTADHGDMMESLRRSYFSSDAAISPEQRPRLLNFTNLFERGSWTMKRYSGLVEAAFTRKNGSQPAVD